MIICGGMGLPRTYRPRADASSNKSDSLNVLDEVIALDLATMTWDLDFVASTSSGSDAVRPSPRYAHLSSVATDYLVILGGQDNDNKYVQQISILDLQRRQWVRNDPLKNQCGSYRSLAVSSPFVVYGPDGTEQQVGSAQSTTSTRPIWLPEKDTTGILRPTPNSRSGSSSSISLNPMSDATGERRNPLSPTTNDQRHMATPGVGSNRSNVPESAGTSSKRLSNLLSGLSPAAATSAASATVPKAPKQDLHLLTTTAARPRQFSSVPTSAAATEEETAEVPRKLPLAPILVYSNYNFADVKRELESIQYELEQPSSSPDAVPATSLHTTDYSERMHELPLPPGLRFPSGFICGSHMIIAGTYLANTTQMFALWVLHLPSLTWCRLETGGVLGSGSWNRALLHRKANQLLVFGDRTRELVRDYNHRQNNWSHIASVDLEAFGVYEPPAGGPHTQTVAQFGLEKLAASMYGTTWDSSCAVASLVQPNSTHATSPTPSTRMSRTSSATAPDQSGEGNDAAANGAEEDGNDPAAVRGVASLSPNLARTGVPPLSTTADASHCQPLYLAHAMGGRGDFEIVCSDGVRVGVDRAVLEHRWPWFRDALVAYRTRAVDAVAQLRSSEPSEGTPMPMPPLQVSGIASQWDPTNVHSEPTSASTQDQSAARDRIRADVRITPRKLYLPEPGVVAVALAEYLYSRSVCTRTQRHPGMLCTLLLLGGLYGLPDLTSWAAHAMHTCLTTDLAVLPPGSTTLPDLTALPLEERQRLSIQFYETAALAGERALQLHALRIAIAVGKWRDRSRNGNHNQASFAMAQTGSSSLPGPPPPHA